MSSGVRWVLLGLLGLLVAGTVAFLGIRTVSEKIGISSESPAIGRSLAPASKAPAGKKPSPRDDASSSAPVTTAAQPKTAPAPGGGDDYANGGDNERGDD